MNKDKIKYISRREFLKLTGLTTGAVAVGSVILNDEIALSEELFESLAHGKGIETWQNTICRQCAGGCGISVRKIDGLPVYVKGNPIYPVNRGGVCPMAHTSLELLYNPDRIKHPLMRNGTKGQGNWKTTEWSEVLSSISNRIKKLIASGNGRQIALLNGDESSLMRDLCRHWMKAAKSPYYMEDERLNEDIAAATLTQGLNTTPSADLINSRYILNFGANLFEEGSSPVYYQNIFGQFRSSVRGARTKLVHIDSRMNLTAASSDRWIPIRPGTYAAFALGIAYVLITEKLFDSRFVEDNTFGFKSFRDIKGIEHQGFESFVRGNYYPEKVSELTGIPAIDILRIGEEFGTNEPALAISGNASRYSTNGGFSQWAVYCLNALKGNFQKKGGIYFTREIVNLEFPELAVPDSSFDGQAGIYSPFGKMTLTQFAERLKSDASKKIDTLIIVNSNPIFNSRNKEILTQIFHRIENVIYLGTILDETAVQSDIVLPDHSDLEKTELTDSINGLMFTHIGYQNPVVEPMFDTRHSGDVLIELGKEIFGNKAFPWKNYDNLIRDRVKSIFDSGEGTLISESSDKEWLAYLKERGWQMQQYQSFEEFFKIFKSKGGWWNPIIEKLRSNEIYRTRSGKFEFVSSTFKERLAVLSKDSPGDSDKERRDRVLSQLGITARGDDLLVPHHEPPLESAKSKELPLILTSSELSTNRNGKGASQPSMMEIVGIQVGRYWKSWMEINPVTAKSYNLKDRKMAWLESSKGRLKIEVRTFEGIRPDTVHVHLGMGHTAVGRFGTGIGVNITDIIENNFDSITNAPALNGTRVKVSNVTMGD